MRMMILTAAALLTGCAGIYRPAAPADAFMARLATLCGQSFAGRLVTNDPADAVMAGQPMVMQLRDCSPTMIRIPFHVGDDRSRTWVLTRTGAGVRLKHDHRHRDGSSDPLTQYGGDNAGPGSAMRQVFPADAESIALFRRSGRDVSVANVWAIEVDAARFAYELRRPPGPGARHFRVEFDLTRPVEAPPSPWGG